MGQQFISVLHAHTHTPFTPRGNLAQLINRHVCIWEVEGNQRKPTLLHSSVQTVSQAQGIASVPYSLLLRMEHLEVSLKLENINYLYCASQKVIKHFNWLETESNFFLLRKNKNKKRHLSNVCEISSVFSCWEQNINMGYWWIIRSPILLSVLVSLSITFCSSPLRSLIVLQFPELHTQIKLSDLEYKATLR